MSNHCTYITRHPTGLFYIGKGKTLSVKNGRYKGSGVGLKSLWASTHPKHEWTSQVISEFNTAEAAYDHEKYLISIVLLDSNNLNLANGGMGIRGNFGKGMLGKKLSEKTKNKMRVSALNKCADKEYVNKRNATLKHTWSNVDQRRKNIDAMNMPDAIIKRSQASKTRWVKHRIEDSSTIEIVSEQSHKILATFKSVNIAAEALECTATLLYTAIRRQKIIGARIKQLKERCYVRRIA